MNPPTYIKKVYNLFLIALLCIGVVAAASVYLNDVDFYGEYIEYVSYRMLNETVEELVSNRLLNETLYEYVSNRVVNSTLDGYATIDYVSNRMLNTTVESLVSQRLLNDTLYDYVSNRAINNTAVTFTSVNVTSGSYHAPSTKWRMGNFEEDGNFSGMCYNGTAVYVGTSFSLSDAGCSD